MITDALERHICDTIKEWQIKIGYQHEPMKLYYPDVSLIASLELDPRTTEKELYKALGAFAQAVEERLGHLHFSNEKDRFCIEVPAEGCAYIDQKFPDPAFLRDFLQVITGKGNTLSEVRTCFQSYAKKHQLSCTELDQRALGLGHVFYFTTPDGGEDASDPYVYCIEEDDFGLTYHRFSRVDYEKLVDESKEVRDHAQECVMCK